MAPKEDDTDPKMTKQEGIQGAHNEGPEAIEKLPKSKTKGDESNGKTGKNKAYLLSILLNILLIIAAFINIFEHYQDDPPKAIIQFLPEQPILDKEIVFISRSTDDKNISECTFIWDFGDGNTSEGDVVRHSYHEVGIFTVILTVRDTNGGVDTTKNIVSIKPNNPPVADFVVPSNAKVNEYLRFDAAKSHGNDGKIVTYYWEFGDGTNSTNPSPEHYYTKEGKYEIRLTVTDDYGGSASTNRTIMVVAEIDKPIEPQPPIFVFEPPNIKISEKINSEAPKSDDPERDDEINKSNLEDSIGRMSDLNNGFTINNLSNGSTVARFINLIGEYPADFKDDIWIFVKPPNSLYYPQSWNNGPAKKVNGKWEMQIGIGSDGNRGHFEIILTTADVNTSSFINAALKAGAFGGFEDLRELGIATKQNITVIRNNEGYAPAPDISNIHLPGRVSVTNIKDGDEIQPTETLNGTHYGSEVIDEIWVLVFNNKVGLWYPQPTNPHEEYTHAQKHDDGTWNVTANFGGDDDINEPFDVVVVLANADANRELDAKQKNWSRDDHYPGLLTIELPQGIEEKDRVRVYRI